MILQLNPPLWLDTPKGMSLCHFMIDYGPDFDIVWVCFIQDTGECWSFDNSVIKIARNETLGRR